MTTSDQSYESVKPASFTTVLTSHTSCQRSQVKSRDHGKTHIFQRRIKYFEAVITVVKKRRKELNYGQKLAFQSKQFTTTETCRIGHQDRRIKSKNYYILRHTGAHQVTTKTSSHNRHFGTRIQGIGTNYTHLCLVQPLLNQMQSTRLQEELAAYPVERK